jgi:eukaryotic-like serine/threonine-protein kinase
VQQGDRPLPPGRAECTEPHYWETFAAIPLPAGAVTDRDLSHLMERPDVAAVCSADTITERSQDPTHTAEWRRDAWPIPADEYTVLVHCLGGALEGETPGAVFRSE